MYDRDKIDSVIGINVFHCVVDYTEEWRPIII